MQALEIENLSKTYKNGVEALKGISFVVEQGDFFALLGPNGAGKSTAIGIISSLVRKTSGRVRIFGIDIDHDFSTTKQQLGIVPQEINFNLFHELRDILTTQAGYYGMPYYEAKKRTKKYLALLGLSDMSSDIAQNLSGGMKRRLMIARSMLHEPKMLILDEPTAGIDIETRRLMWDFLREINTAGTTIILTTHYLEEAENLCRHIGIINHGKIIENATLPDFLSKLDCEHFILYLDAPCDKAPCVPPYDIKRMDAITLDVEISKTGNVSDLLAGLAQQNIVVKSMRNKTNRLEELFIRMTQEEST